MNINTIELEHSTYKQVPDDLFSYVQELIKQNADYDKLGMEHLKLKQELTELKAKVIEYEGSKSYIEWKEASKCCHDKVYANHMLCSSPPQYPWVCRKCKERGTDREAYAGVTGEYEMLTEETQK